MKQRFFCAVAGRLRDGLFPLFSTAAIVCGLGLSTLRAGDYISFAGVNSDWHGFQRNDFVMDEATFDVNPFQPPAGERFGVGAPPHGQRRCIVVVPKQSAPGNPWSWRGCYWDHEPQTEVELLRRGFHIAFITPDPDKTWDAFYTWLTDKHGLGKKPAFVGMSKGGVNEYDWTTVNPDKVSCIYADNPAIRPEAFLKLGALAKNDVALLNVCGSQDFLLQRHTLPIEDRYRRLGGRITVMIKDGPAHHPHSLKNPQPIADWITSHMLPAEDIGRPKFADDKYAKSYYYSQESTNVWLKEEKTYANCRGPGYTECYSRYDSVTASQWGLIGLSVIVPKAAAPGKPWVFRADNITRDAVIDQALLARGFHIVIPAIVAQSGAVQTNWDAAYKLVTGHGFAKKVVMEGTATAAGEAYAWAIENPDKVACVVGINPAIRSLMVKTPPMDRLDVLAKASIPILHVSDKTDPWRAEYTDAAARRYKELGGEMTVILNESENHAPLASADRTRAVELIVGKAH
ncbi:MAG TPA: alpha/beta hydrolase [Verrucomicrobiae bacterium]|nr:alpha/beta hydrolase [Verrucomicrobiae bacterium]